MKFPLQRSTVCISSRFSITLYKGTYLCVVFKTGFLKDGGLRSVGLDYRKIFEATGHGFSCGYLRYVVNSILGMDFYDRAPNLPSWFIKVQFKRFSNCGL